MANLKFSKRNLKNFIGVRPHLVAVAAQALHSKFVDFVVVEGVRPQERQQYLYDHGKSKTLKSAHLKGNAIDCYPIVNGEIEFDHVPTFIKMYRAFNDASDHLGVPIRWGGDWDEDKDFYDSRFFDGPYFELNKRSYDWNEPHEPWYEGIEEWPDHLKELLMFGTDLFPFPTMSEPVAPPPSPIRRANRPVFLGGER